MAGVHMTLNGNISGIEHALNDALRALDNPAPLLDDIGAAMVNQTLLRFDSARDPDGVSWIPSIRAMLEGGKTLQDDGHLRGSITHNVTVDGVEWGSDKVYALIHQLSGKTGRNQSVTIDARRYLGISNLDEDIIGESALSYLTEALHG